MFYTATVIDNIDPKRTGIIEVYVPAIMTKQQKGVKKPEKRKVNNSFNILNSDVDQNEINNIEIEARHTIPAYPHTMTSKNHGSQLIPEINDEVLIYFKDNNYDVAYYMYANSYQNGLLMDYGDIIEDKENSENPEKCIDHKVLLLTKSKHVIALNDTEESNGIFIKASGSHKIKLEKNDNFSGFIVETEKGHQFFIDDSNNGIKISSKSGHSFLIDDQNDGINIKTKDDFRLTMDSRKKMIQIVTPMGIGLEFDDKNNKLRVAALDIENNAKNTIKHEAENEISLKSKVKAGIETTDIDMKANNGIKMDATSLKIEVKANCSIEATANVDIKAKAGVNVEATGPANVKSNATLTIDAPMINIGEGAVSSIVKGTEFLALFNAHMHTAPPMGGPTTPPVIPIMEPQCCTIQVKTK